MIRLKTIFINICITFTLLTVYSLTLGLSSGNDVVLRTDLLVRLLVCVIGFGSTIMFNWFTKWPLRFVQLLHYFVSNLLIIGLFLFLDPVKDSYYLDTLKGYSIGYIIVVILYEIKYRLDIRRKNRLLEKLQDYN